MSGPIDELPDGRTDLSPVFPVKDDPYSLVGGRRLGPEKYNDWQFSIGLDALTAVVNQWGQSQRPPITTGSCKR